MFWLLVVGVGIMGAVADVILSQWSENGSSLWWVGGAIGYLVFMTGLGIIIRMGTVAGFPLTIAVVLVLLTNVATLMAWDVFYVGTPFSVIQLLGIALALASVVSFEFGRRV